MTVMFEFPSFWKMILDMIKTGSGYVFESIILPPDTKLREQESVTNLLDVSLLPKSIGGDAVSVDDETGEQDERCVRGWKHLTVSAFVRALR